MFNFLIKIFIYILIPIYFIYILCLLYLFLVWLLLFIFLFFINFIKQILHLFKIQLVSNILYKQAF